MGHFAKSAQSEMSSKKRIAVVCLVAACAWYWKTYVVKGPQCNSSKNLSGKTVLITGEESGVIQVKRVVIYCNEILLH